MKATQILVFALLSCLLSTTAFGQATERATRRAKNRAEQRTNQRVDQKVDQAVDKVFDDLFGKRKKKTTDETGAETDPADADNTPPSDAEAQRSVLGMLGMSDEEWEPKHNDYPMSFVMETTTTKNNKTDEVTMAICLGEWKTGYQIIDADKADKTMHIILDNQEGTMTTITREAGKAPEGMQMRQVMFRSDRIAQEVEDKMDEYSFRKTGRTKVIDGYNCEEYAVEGPEGSGLTWITDEIEISWGQVVAGSFFGGGRGQQQLPGMDVPYEGFPIESTWTDAKGKETSVSRYRNIRFGDDIDRSLLETGDVPIQKIGY